MIRNLFSERKISDFIGHVTPSVYTLFPVPLSGNPLTNGQHGDKYLSQRKSSKQPLFPYQMTSEDSANSAPPLSPTPPQSSVWLFVLHLLWEQLALWIRVFIK